MNKDESTIRIILISLMALLIGHLMYTTNISLFLIGIVATTLFIYSQTLKHNNLFNFIMVMYFCNLFAYQLARGGAFNFVSLLGIAIYSLATKKSIFENKRPNKKFHFFIFLWMLSSILGWLFRFVGPTIDLMLSIVSFGGIISLLLMSGNLILTEKRIAIFLKLNIFLISYSLFASINAYLKILPLSPMMPRWAEQYQGRGDGLVLGGIIGVSPLYGQHSLLLAVLFSVFFFIGIFIPKNVVKQKYLLYGAIISYINVFLSISKAVFFSLLIGLVIIILLQSRIKKINFNKRIFQFFILIVIVLSTLFLLKVTKLDYIFTRIEMQSERNMSQGSLISWETILDGSALNRSTAFYEAFKKYHSKKSWILGYGWGLSSNNRYAFYVDPTIRRSSAHSQIFAILFLFGWLGSFAFWGLHIYSIWESYRFSRVTKYTIPNRIYALASILMLTMLILHGVTADNITYPTYFSSTMIILGLTYANLNSGKLFSKFRGK